MQMIEMLLKTVQAGTIGLCLIQIGCRGESPQTTKAKPVPTAAKPAVEGSESPGACERAATFVCNEMGENSGVCGLIQGSKAKMKPSRCEKMMADPAGTLADLRQMEESRLPLSAEKQAMLAAGDPPALGSRDAPVTVVLFSDFHCTSCVYMGHVAPGLKLDFGDDVRVIFRQHPGSGQWSATAAEASLAAHAQGRFWEYYRQLYNNLHDMSRDTIVRCAKETGLKLKPFEQALENRTYQSAVDLDVALAKTVLAGPAPYFFVNGRRVAGVNSIQQLKSVIQEEIQKE